MHLACHPRRGACSRPLLCARCALVSLLGAVAGCQTPVRRRRMAVRQRQETTRRCTIASTRAIRTGRSRAKSPPRSPPRLLLQPKEYLIGENVVGEDARRDLYDTSDVLGTCDVFSASSWCRTPIREWITITRPYYRGSYVYVAADPAWKSLADMPTTRAIGATIGTSADLRLIQYLLALRAGRALEQLPDVDPTRRRSRRWRTGRSASALVWAPALWALRTQRCRHREGPEMSPSPLPASTADVGAMLLANEIVPAQQPRSGDCLADRRRHHRGHPGRRQISARIDEPGKWIRSNATAADPDGPFEIAK